MQGACASCYGEASERLCTADAFDYFPGLAPESMAGIDHGADAAAVRLAASAQCSASAFVRVGAFAGRGTHAEAEGRALRRFPCLDSSEHGRRRGAAPEFPGGASAGELALPAVAAGCFFGSRSRLYSKLTRPFTMSASRPMLTDDSQASSSQAAVHEDVLRGQEERLALVDDEDMQNLVSDLEVAARKQHVELKPADCSGRTEGPADPQRPVLREELGLSAAGLPVASAALPPATSQARAPCTEDSGDRWNGAGLAQQPQALLNCMQDVSTALDQRSGVKRPAAAVEKLRTGLGCDEDRGQAAEPEQRDEPRPRRPRGRPAAAVMSANAARAGPCKRPAGSVATGGQPAPCRRPAAVCALKRPAARRGVKPRHDGLRPVPAHLLAKYKNGCSTCRYTPGCCPSCWRKRGY